MFAVDGLCIGCYTYGCKTLDSASFLSVIRSRVFLRRRTELSPDIRKAGLIGEIMQENGKDNRKNNDRRRPDLKGRGVRILSVVLTAVLLVGAAALIVRYTPTNRRMTDADYFGQMEEDEAAIILGSGQVPERAIALDGALYIPYDLVSTTLNPRFYWDADIGKMLFTTADQEFEIPVNARSFSVIDGILTSDPVSEESYDRLIVYRPDDGRITGTGDGAEGNTTGLYVSIDFLQKYTQVEYSWEKDTDGKTAGHVLVSYQWGEVLTARSRKEAAVRYQGGIKSPILTDLLKGDSVTVLEELDGWLKVLTEDGYIGYVKASRMSKPEQTTVSTALEAQTYPSIKMDGKVNLVWHQVSTKDGNDNLKNAISGMTGVNVLSPTWFSLKDNDGNITSIASAKYVKEAHKRDIQVWGLVSDFSSDMDTSKVLASTAARRTCIGQLADAAAKYDLDGINLDFEYMEEADAAAYVQFVRELSIECRLAGLVLSVDMKPPYDFNYWMDRKEVGTVADYVINMGYDEHYSGSEAGSVASLPYEENAIAEYLAQGVPGEKLISGVPFYTRIWYTSENSDGTSNISSEVLSMLSAEQTLESWNVTPLWDTETSQHLADWTTDDGVRCRIWLEDEDSIAAKARLIPRYGLGGIAAWSLGFEDNGIWDVISKNISLSAQEAEEAEAEAGAEIETEAGTKAETETEADDAV